MPRTLFVAILALAQTACNRESRTSDKEVRPAALPFVEDTPERYVELREGQRGVSSSNSARVKHRPELDRMREINGDLRDICYWLHGPENPRIVVESQNRNFYRVVYKQGDRGALPVIAKPLGLMVLQEEREVDAITIRVAQGGHRLKPVAKGLQAKLDEVELSEGRWPLDGVTADELARFLEIRFRRPVTNLTALEGRWSILLSDEVARVSPEPREIAPLEQFGLELRWERVRLPVTVVKDGP